MILYVSAKANTDDLYIDYIEVQLKNGKSVSLNWDESDISRFEDGFEARYKGVYFGEEYANGKIDELKDLKVTDVGLYSNSNEPSDFVLDSMLFDDDGRELHFDGILYAERAGENIETEMFILDDDLYACQDEKCESVDAYLWAMSPLVARMKEVIKDKHSVEEMECLDNINFYAYYNLRDSSIEVNGTYWYFRNNEEEQGEFILPLSSEEKKDLIVAIEDYCQKRYGRSCLTFVNEGRAEDGLSPIEPVSSLNSKIQSAQERRAAFDAKLDTKEKNQER